MATNVSKAGGLGTRLTLPSLCGSGLAHETSNTLHCCYRAYSPQLGWKAMVVIGVAGMHWRQNVAWNPAGSTSSSFLHSRGDSFRNPDPRRLESLLPRKISAMEHWCIVTVCMGTGREGGGKGGRRGEGRRRGEGGRRDGTGSSRSREGRNGVRDDYQFHKFVTRPHPYSRHSKACSPPT